MGVSVDETRHDCSVVSAKNLVWLVLFRHGGGGTNGLYPAGVDDHTTVVQHFVGLTQRNDVVALHKQVHMFFGFCVHRTSFDRR